MFNEVDNVTKILHFLRSFLIWNQRDHVGLNMEKMGVNFEKSAQILWSLEKCGPEVYVEMIFH